MFFNATKKVFFLTLQMYFLCRGNCRLKNNCTDACDGGKGTVQFNGICQCQDIKTVEEICPIECVKNLPDIYFTSNGTVEIKTADGKLKTNINFKENLIGTANCAKEDATECKITAVGMTDNPNGDFSGSFGIPDTIDFSEDEQKEIGIPENSLLYTERFYTGKRKKVSPNIKNPFSK